MNRLILFYILITAPFLSGAQEARDYTRLLEQTHELRITDSLLFQPEPASMTPLDSQTIKQWFPQVLPANAANKFKNRSFALAGKMTGNPQFDLLILCEEKRKSDSSGTQVVYLVSVKKTGEYIASIKAAVGGSKKKTAYNISSWLYRDLKIVQDSRIQIDDRSYNDMVYYKINNGGRFVSYPRFD